MKEPKFKLGQIVFTAQEYRLGRFEVKEIIVKTNKDGEKVEYSLEDPFGRQHIYPEAPIIEDFETARKQALTNWENIYKNTKATLEQATEALFDEMRKEAEEKKKVKNEVKKS